MKLKIFEAAWKSAQKHSPGILTAIGIVGVASTVVLAVKATPKALQIIDAEKVKNADLTTVDTVKATWKYYIPAAVTGVVSIGCILGASKIHTMRNAGLAAAYSLSEVFAREYQDKVREELGEKKEKEIRDGIAIDRMKKTPPGNKEIIFTGKGDSLCYDAMSGRYFKSNYDKIKAVCNDLNFRLLNEMSIGLNEFYYELGLPPIKMGEMLGWCLEYGQIELSLTSALTDDNIPCLSIDFKNRPRYEFF